MLDFAKSATTGRNFIRRIRVYGGPIVLLLAFSQIASRPAYANPQQSADRDQLRRMNEQIQELQVMLVRHTDTMFGAPGVFHTPGFYTQFSRRFGRYRPYVRYDYVNAGVAEPIYGDPADGPVVGRRNGPTLGIRFDMNDHAAFKLEYDHLAERGQKSFSLLESQFSFAF